VKRSISPSKIFSQIDVKAFVLQTIFPRRPVDGDRESEAAPKVKANRVYKVRARADRRGVDLISDVLPWATKCALLGFEITNRKETE
jgi:hypothetical protein